MNLLNALIVPVEIGVLLLILLVIFGWDWRKDE